MPRVLAEQRCGIIATALGETGATGTGAEPLVLHPDAHRLHTTREIRTGRGSDHAILDLLGRTHTEERLGGENERTQVERVFTAARHPLHILFDKRGAGTQEIIDGHFRQIQALGGILQTFRIAVRAEQPSGTVGMAICLEPSKHSCA